MREFLTNLSHIVPHKRGEEMGFKENHDLVEVKQRNGASLCVVELLKRL